MTDFTFRIFLTDYYLAKPIPYVDNIFNDFNCKEIFQIPIIRVFGTTPKGQKVCAHIHGVFPYFYVAFVQDIAILNDESLLKKYLLDFGKFLNQAISTSLESKQTNNSFVYKIVLVKGKQFYGYQDKFQYFLKIFLFNPIHIKKAADLLLSGAVMGKEMQPYEAHIPYNLKFFIDYNLYGMNFLYTDGAKFRLDSEYEKRYEFCDESSQMFKNLSQKMWNIEEMNCDKKNNGNFMNQQTCPKVSFSELEVDIAACDILNILEIDEHLGQNPGLKSLWEEEKQRRIDLGMNMPDREPVGQVFEERPLAQCTKSERDLFVSWQKIFEKTELDMQDDCYQNDIDEFICASPRQDDSSSPEYYNPLESFVNVSDLNLKTTETMETEMISQGFVGDQFREEWEDDTVLQEFINNNDIDGFTKGPSSVDKQNKRNSVESVDLYNSFLPVKQELDENDVIVIDSETEDESEDVFGKTFIDLSLDDEDEEEQDNREEKKEDEVEKEKRKWEIGIVKKDEEFEENRNKSKVNDLKIQSNRLIVRNVNSSCEDLFAVDDDNDSVIILSSDDSCSNVEDLCILETYDGADDDDNVNRAGTQKRKIIGKPTAVVRNIYRSPILTRSQKNRQEIPTTSSAIIDAKKYFMPLIAKRLKLEKEARAKKRELSMRLKTPIVTETIDGENCGRNFQITHVVKSEISMDHDDRRRDSGDEMQLSSCFQSTSPSRRHSHELLSQKPSGLPQQRIVTLPQSQIEEVIDDADLQWSQKSANSSSSNITMVDHCHPSSSNQLFSTPTRSQGCTKLSQRFFKNISPIVISKTNNILGNDVFPSSPCFSSNLIHSFSQHNDHINRSNQTVLKEISDNGKTIKGHEKFDNQSVLIDNLSEQEEDWKSQKLSHLKMMKQSIHGSTAFNFSANTTLVRPKYTDVCHLTILSVEIFCSSQLNLNPNPKFDPILMVFYTVYDEADLAVEMDNENDESVEDKDVNEGLRKDRMFQGLIYVSQNDDVLIDAGIVLDDDRHSVPVSNELELMDKVIELVWEFDPDILVGFETSRSSWGYLYERSLHIKHRLWNELGRIVQPINDKIHPTHPNGLEGAFKETQLRCIGRIFIDLWLVMKYEVTLNSYTLENCVREVLNEVVPCYTNQQLLAWYRSNHERALMVRHFGYRVLANVKLLKKINFISRTSEFAKVFGIEFEHVYMRGSQYRVESMMLRLAKPQNLIGLSPSVNQRCQQKAPECIPLTLEPMSGLYRDPVVVLDFQSLYPSIMIAYNYCYSTTLGKIDHIVKVPRGDPYEVGCGKMSLSNEAIKKIGSNVTISPNGVAFVKPQIEKGIISKMVEEILDTRIMIKKSMKIHSKNKTLHRLLDSRQLGLKLIANVTFGYTAASYSGRMPCVEVGDSIVRKARETLFEAIKLVNSGGPRGERKSDACGGWDGCSVLYGDTDSLFVLMPNRSKAEAFVLGARIVEAVNELNPFPVRLQLEKVFMPCLLEAKKKYVGMAFETADQQEPIFIAKGIETIRRDNCRIVSKTLEGVLNRLFLSISVENIKKYIIQKIDNVQKNKVNIIDFIIAKEYRGRNNYKQGASIPALQIANELSKIDPRAEPLKGDRVPYVVIQGAPGETLISCIRRPEDIVFNTRYIKAFGTNLRQLNERGCRLSATYYISKQILPPLDRALSLVGIDVFKWYAEIPKRNSKPTLSGRLGAGTRRQHVQILNRTISSYFQSQNCLLCLEVIKKKWNVPEDRLVAVLCERCISKGKKYIYLRTMTQLKDIEECRKNLVDICIMCTKTDQRMTRGIGPPCVSLDCPTFFNRVRAFQQSTDYLEELLNSSSFKL